ncbi:unnamed protein product [Brassicogethes aeneus]|uniref:Uncharacterized protein n=1 Tax=Brassicogethes aeneus TaxID=1431903 RepID=A0A9P0FGS8_BRAAE|nr:unnamed protein product [Brassicogethes aeneus]
MSKNNQNRPNSTKSEGDSDTWVFEKDLKKIKLATERARRDLLGPFGDAHETETDYFYFLFNSRMSESTKSSLDNDLDDELYNIDNDYLIKLNAIRKKLNMIELTDEEAEPSRAGCVITEITDSPIKNNIDKQNDSEKESSEAKDSSSEKEKCSNVSRDKSKNRKYRQAKEHYTTSSDSESIYNEKQSIISNLYSQKLNENLSTIAQRIKENSHSFLEKPGPSTMHAKELQIDYDPPKKKVCIREHSPRVAAKQELMTNKSKTSMMLTSKKSLIKSSTREFLDRERNKSHENSNYLCNVHGTKIPMRTYEKTPENEESPDKRKIFEKSPEKYIKNRKTADQAKTSKPPVLNKYELSLNKLKSKAFIKKESKPSQGSYLQKGESLNQRTSFLMKNLEKTKNLFQTNKKDYVPEKTTIFQKIKHSQDCKVPPGVCNSIHTQAFLPLESSCKRDCKKKVLTSAPVHSTKNIIKKSAYSDDVDFRLENIYLNQNQYNSESSSSTMDNSTVTKLSCQLHRTAPNTVLDEVNIDKSQVVIKTTTLQDEDKTFEVKNKHLQSSRKKVVPTPTKKKVKQSAYNEGNSGTTVDYSTIPLEDKPFLVKNKVYPEKFEKQKTVKPISELELSVGLDVPKKTSTNCNFPAITNVTKHVGYLSEEVSYVEAIQSELSSHKNRDNSISSNKVVKSEPKLLMKTTIHQQDMRFTDCQSAATDLDNRSVECRHPRTDALPQNNSLPTQAVSEARASSPQSNEEPIACFNCPCFERVIDLFKCNWNL